jgi:hypothetical protein
MAGIPGGIGIGGWAIAVGAVAHPASADMASRAGTRRVISVDLSWVIVVRRKRAAVVGVGHCRNGAALWLGKRILAAQHGGLAAKPYRHLESTPDEQSIQREI